MFRLVKRIFLLCLRSNENIHNTIREENMFYMEIYEFLFSFIGRYRTFFVLLFGSWTCGCCCCCRGTFRTFNGNTTIRMSPNKTVKKINKRYVLRLFNFNYR